MRSIEDLFFLHRTQSASYDEHESGDVAFISNNSGSNGVVGHVKPDKRDRVFDKASIVVSAMSGFSVQVPPFIARGCAGSGLVVLEPRVPLTKRQLWFTAAYLNRTSSWRFNWYRQLTIDRVRRLRIPDEIPDKTLVSIQSLLPENTATGKPCGATDLGSFTIESVFMIHRAKSGLYSEYQSGSVAYVGNGFGDNGVAGFVTPLPTDRVFHYSAVVVSAFCEASMQTPPFVACSRAGNGLLVLEPRTEMSLEQLVCAASSINYEHGWRFNWYRQVTKDRVRKLVIRLPATNGHPDNDLAKAVVSSMPYWSFLKQRFEATH